MSSKNPYKDAQLYGMRYLLRVSIKDSYKNEQLYCVTYYELQWSM